VQHRRVQGGDGVRLLLSSSMDAAAGAPTPRRAPASLPGSGRRLPGPVGPFPSTPRSAPPPSFHILNHLRP